MKTKRINFCKIDPSGSQISIKVTVNNGVRSVGIFSFGKPKANGEYILVSQYKVKTGDSGFEKILTKEDPKLLDGYILSWDIRSCSMINQVEKGEIRVEIFQNETPCKTNIELTYNLKFPQCSEGQECVIRKKITLTHDLVAHNKSDKNETVL